MNISTLENIEDVENIHETKLKNIKIFSGSSHQRLAIKISEWLGLTLGNVTIRKFSNNETYINIEETVRDKDVYIIQSTTAEVDQNIMELLIMIQACRLGSAKRITAVMPYFPYGRQDKKLLPREPITAKLMANLLQSSGADHIITMELHSPQTQAFFDIPVDNMSAEPLILNWIQENIPEWSESVIVSPDAGGAKRCVSIAEHLQLHFALIHKERKNVNKVSNMVLVGDVYDRNVIIVDDMADTCGTLESATHKLLELGARKVYVVVIHGILSGNGCERIISSQIESLTVTNTIDQRLNVEKFEKIKLIDVSHVFAEAIRCSTTGQALSHLFSHLP